MLVPTTRALKTDKYHFIQSLIKGIAFQIGKKRIIRCAFFVYKCIYLSTIHLIMN